MIAPKVIKLISVLILLVAGLLLGCTTSQRPSVSQEGATSTASDGASGDTTEEVDSSSPQVEAEAASETASEVEGEASSPVAADVEATVILMDDAVTTLDPYLMVNTHYDGSIASHVWDTLVLLNDKLELEPQLAESWRLVNNFTWEFKLRQGLKFHNDEPLTAEAVRFSIERAQTLPGSLETFAQDVGLEKVEVMNDYTLHLTTRQPVANLPYHLAFLEILPPVYYTDTDPNQVALAPVGSGPYQVTSTEDGALVLDSVPSYWWGAPALPRLIFKVIPEAEQRLAALAAGEASLVTDLPPTSADQWDVPNSRLEAIESTRRLFVGMRMGEGTPLANKQVRQALNYGVNVGEIIDNNLAGYGDRYGSWVNPPANNPDLEPWPYDPDTARTLLAEAGY
ncbi:MAG TPA: ABC transporter substrate-binding protein, partial [Anaerolineae bacterium]|nr:ABC transporter substrate-binding protein [Anaerolineae bacterium]